MTEIWTARKLLLWTTEYFKKCGIATPRLDAEVLLAHQLGLSRIQLYIDIDKPTTDVERQLFKELIKRRIKHEPVAYITGVKEFWSLPILVGRCVLIPRPETELLVEMTSSKLKDAQAPKIIDFGTGSGCIAAALAHELTTAEITAIDSSAQALEIAQRNIVNLHLLERVTLIVGDWTHALLNPLLHGRFDAIVSNPPYLRSNEIPTLSPEIYRYEPISALDGGVDGLAPYAHLVSAAMQCLTQGGFLIVEIGNGSAESVSRIMRFGGLEDITIYKDGFEYDRVVCGTRP